MSLLKKRSGLLAALALGLAASMPLGAMTRLQVRPGHEQQRGPRPRPQPRNQAKDRLAAAEAKRQRRQARNLTWLARGAFAW